MSVLDKLTEGIVNRDLQKEGAALLSKWEKTGLLEGLDSDRSRSSMASLLENQAKELLREASTMAGGDVEGFAAVAFPIVRRVFGGLIANDLVSVQPMSLPSGLIFFLDFQHTFGKGGTEAADSVYGGGKVGQEITGGVDLTGQNAEEGFYALNNGYASPTGSATSTSATWYASGTVGANGGFNSQLGAAALGTSAANIGELQRICKYDPDLSGSAVFVVKIAVTDLVEDTTATPMNLDNLVALAVDPAATAAEDLGGHNLVRRLTQFSGSARDHILCVVELTGTLAAGLAPAGIENTVIDNAFDTVDLSLPLADDFTDNPDAGADNAIGAVAMTDSWGLENTQEIPEIDIKVDSVSVTAMTKKLKAKWTPELGQDLNAYHNLDAEVELTGILSEQIALEIDREILADLINGATAGKYYWSRRPGKFVNRTTGEQLEVSGGTSALGPPDFTGTVSEWYETLCETINDVSAQIHRKTLRGGANFIVCSPEVANILEFTSGFRADVTGDADRGTVGAVKAGSLSKKWDVYVDPYFPRQVVLVGRKGGSFLESGYVYAPYVPLQITPTIFGVEDFVPRKGVMTRYAKKMVRPDMYGLVIVADLLG